jgi:filamentous hemagglutinin family protein
MFRHASLNRIYRLVWSESRNAYVAVAENTRARGKRSGTVGSVLCVALGAAAMPLCAGAAAPTTVVPTGGNTAAYIAPNGVPVVDIKTANAAGVSHNQYLKYNVDPKGLVLNNGNSSQMARQSQLAGQVMANANLDKQASLILNEVVAANRSQLSGYTEVLGGKADVVVANPYGITCSGCGFINTDRATLTTGVPVLNGNGGLDGFRVTGGDLLINGSGVNASAQQILDLVARSINIEGQVNANDLGLVAGANTWNYSSRAVTGALAPTDATPVYAIDSSALGGMYANRIRIVATEAGVGVRMRGDAAASGSDFTLDASGKITLQNKISAAQDLRIASTASGAALALTNNTLTAKRDLELSATQGTAQLNGGVLQANRNLSIDVATLSDTATATALADNNKRFAGANLQVNATGSVALNGTSYGSGGALGVDAGSVAVGAAGATLYGNTVELNADNDIALGTAAVQATGALALTADNGTLSTAAGAAQGIKSSAGDVRLTANAIDNAGSISAVKGDLIVRGDTIDNVASGKLHAAGDISIADQSGAGSEDVDNAGTVIAGGTLDIAADHITNTGSVQAAMGSTVAASSLTNSGTIIGATAADGDAQFNVRQLNNSGTMQAARDLQLNVRDTLTNSGKVLATRDLSIEAVDAGTTLAVANQANGTLQAGAALKLQGTAGANNLALTTQANSLALGKRLEVDAASVTNAGILQGGSDGIDIDVSGALSNSGKVISGGASTIDASTIVNTGTVQSALSSTTNATAIANSGTWIASSAAGQSATFNADSLANSGTLQSSQDLTLNLQDDLQNSGKVLATRDLSIAAADSAATLAIANQAGGRLQAGNLLQVRGSGTGYNTTLNTQANSTVFAKGIDLKVGSLTNAGRVEATTGGAVVDVDAALNNSGVLLSGAGMTTRAASIDNSGTIQAATGSTTTANTLSNSGTWIAATDGAGAADFAVNSLTNSGTLQSAGDLSLKVRNALSNSGDLLAVDDLSIEAADSGTTLAVENQANGVLQAGDSLEIRGTAGAGNATFTAYANSKALARRLDVIVASLTNSGLIQGGSGASNFTVTNAFINNSGAKFLLANDAAGSGTLSANTISNAGTIQSKGGFAMNVGSSLTNTASGATNIGILSDGAMTIRGRAAPAYTITNSGRLQSSDLLDIKGYGNGSAVNMTIGTGGVVLGDSVAINANTLTIAGNGTSGGLLSSFGDMTLALNTLSFGGQYSRIVAAMDGGDAEITLANSFSNPGAIYSGGNLTFNLPSLTNTLDGGIGAAGTLILRATAGDLYNVGALFAGDQLTASATGTFTNYYDNAADRGGSIDSSGSMDLSAPTFINNSAINASQNISISATTFRNEVTGGDSRAWGEYSTKTHTQTGYDSQGYNGHGCCDQYETWYYTDTWYRDQYYTAGTPEFQPQLIAGATLTIEDFTVGKNLGGVISGNTVNITGVNGATFLNDALALSRDTVTETYSQEIKYVAAGPAEYHDDRDSDYHRGSNTSHGYSDLSSVGASVRAQTLNVNVAGVTNAGSPLAATVHSSSETGDSGASGVAGETAKNAKSAIGGGSAVDGANTVSGGTSASGAPTIAFGGQTITLPVSPNGYYVTNKTPQSDYLVETNPLFAVGSTVVGTNYLAERYGYDPEVVVKRLGDANYEAFLLKQQLIKQVGANLIGGYTSEAAQMQGLMDNAVAEGKRLGFEYGKQPSVAQLASLKEDVVWMVETVVAGQKVLAPVVYLSAATRASFEAGNAVFAGTNVKMNVDTFSNVGGTVSGSNQLDITAKNDIVNTSGTIKGGNVQLASTEGSIVNQTFVSTSGDASSQQQTTVGKQAGIQATNNLSLDAAKDITNLGANISAGGDASLAAGGNVTFDTVENKNASTTHSASGGTFNSSMTSTTVATTEQIKSGLSAGGNLSVSSKNDVTFAGTDVKAGGDATIDAQGDVNFLARANTSTTTTQTVTDGLGVGGGLVGTQTTDSEAFKSRNVGSTLDVGGNAKLKAGNDLTLEGSTVDVGGNADIAATNVNVLAGKDEDRTTTTTTTTTFLKVDTGSSNNSSGSDSGSGATSGDGAASAEASASAETGNTSSGGIKFAETSTTTTSTYDKTSVGSSINVGGNLKVDAKETVQLVGSEMAAGGDADIKATDVKVLAAQDIHTSSTTTTTTSIGLMAESENKAGARASADAKVDSNDMSARANAEASADASSSNTINFAKTSTETTDSLEINNQGSAIKAGGNMSVDASNKLTTQGSSLESGGDMNLQAKDMEFLAANDVKTTTITTDTTTVGMYYDGSAEAKASTTAGGDGIGYTSADVGAEASAKAGIEAGYQGKNVKTSNTEGSTTAVTSSIKSGGNMNRSATGSITDVGTQVEAGGDFSQSATTIESKAAENTTFSSSSSDSHTARLGAYAEADASVEAGADSSGEAGAAAGANAGAGLHASYKNEKEASSSSSSTAVVSNIKAGGNINSKSTEKTSLEGTNFTAGNDVNLEAGSLDFKAAQDKSSSSSSNSNIDADVKAGINFGSDGKVKGSLGGGYGEQETADSSTTAVTGSINSGGNLNIKTRDDARFEGTDLNAGGDANVAAGGNVTFDAAKNTQTSSAEGFDVSAELNLSKAKSGDNKGGLKAEGGYNLSSSDASQAVVSNINSGGKLNISAGKDATFEGTNIASGDDASISAKNNLAFNAARDTSSSESLDVNAALELSASKGSGKSSSTGGLSAEAEYSKEKSSTAVTGSINSGGNLKLSSGKDTTLEGTQVGAAGTVGIDAGGKVDVKAAQSTSESLSVGGGIGGSVEKSSETDAGGKTTKQTARSGDLSVDIEGGKSSTATVASISGGKGIDIKAGSDANFEGTQLKSNGDTNIAAGGNVNLSAAESSEISGGFAGGISSGTGPKLNKAEIGGGVQNEVATVETAGNLNIKSGGKTTLEGTQATAGGNATIDAQGGVEKKTVVSGGAELGLTKADASLDVQKTSIQSEGRALVPMTDQGFKTSVALPAIIPAGKKVEAATADGKPLPAWLKFDDKTGSFTGTPPADFKGNLNVVVKVPDANGGVSEIPLRFQGQ